MVQGEKAYRVFPPVCAAQGQVGNLKWSPDGRFLAIIRTSTDGLVQTFRNEIANPGSQKTMPPMAIVLEVFNPATGRTTVGGRWEPKESGTPPPVVEVQWMAGTSYLFVTAREQRLGLRSESRGPESPTPTTLERVDAASGQRTTVLTTPDSDTITLGLSPTQPMGFAYYNQGEQLARGSAATEPRERTGAAARTWASRAWLPFVVQGWYEARIGLPCAERDPL